MPSPETMGRTEPGVDTGRYGHRAVAMSVLTTQTSRRGLISSCPGALKEWLWSARICPSSLAGTEHGWDASLWDEQYWKLQSSGLLLAAREPRLCLQEQREGDCGFKLVTKAGQAAVGRMDCQSHRPCAPGERTPFWDLRKQASSVGRDWGLSPGAVGEPGSPSPLLSPASCSQP